MPKLHKKTHFSSFWSASYLLCDRRYSASPFLVARHFAASLCGKMCHAAFCRTIVPDGLMKNRPLPANPPDPFSVDELWLYGGMSYEQNNACFMFEVHRLAQVFAEAGAVSIILSWSSLVSDQRHHRAADDDRIPRVHFRYTITASPRNAR